MMEMGPAERSGKAAEPEPDNVSTDPTVILDQLVIRNMVDLGTVYCTVDFLE